MPDDLRSLIMRLAALEEAARGIPAVVPGDPTAAVNPALQRVIDEERLVVEQIRQLRSSAGSAGGPGDTTTELHRGRT